jgi:hypothetical protein
MSGHGPPRKPAPGKAAGEERPAAPNMDEIVRSIVRANRERRQKAKGERLKGRRKVRSVVDRLLSGDE